MEKITKSISAFILAIIVAINAFGNFIGIGDIIPTEPATTAAVTTTVPEATTAIPAASDSQTTTLMSGVMPESKAEIVAYFNAVINNAKTNSKSITSNYTKHSVAGTITGIPSVIDTVLGGAGSFIDSFMGEDDSKANVTWTSAADKNAYFPVEGETYASKLTAEDVKNAQIVEKDGNYVIKIETVADAKSSEVAHGKGHVPKAFNVVLPVSVEENIPAVVMKLFSISYVGVAYPNGTVMITVDPETRNVISANYVVDWTIYILLGDGEAVIPLSTESDYSINW